MSTKSELQGVWKQIEGAVREKWGQLTDNDLQEASGSVQKLMATIQRRTGQARDQIEETLASMMDQAESLGGQAYRTAGGIAGRAAEMAGSAAETVQNAAAGAADSLRQGVEQTKRMVAERPAQSLSICFGIGVAIGLATGMLLCRRG